MVRLEEKLRRTRESASERMPEHAIEVLGSHSRELETANRAAEAIGVGDAAPDFRLSSTKRGEVQLTELLARGPVILNFYRGRW